MEQLARNPIKLGQPLTLHQLHIFATIAHAGSFTKAAEVLLLGVPTVSEHIKQLEHVLHVRLFERERHSPIVLTEAGRRLLLRCEHLSEVMVALMQDLDSMQRVEQGCVAFGAGAYFCSHLLPSLYAGFQQKVPGITIRVDADAPQDLVDAVLRGHLDLAVIHHRVQDPRLAAFPLGASDLMLVAAPGHPLTAAPNVPFSALTSQRLIAPYRATWGDSDIVRRAMELGMEVITVWEAGGIEAQMNAVASGLGIGLVPSYAVRSRIAMGLLSSVEVEGFPVHSERFLVSLAGELPAHVTRFRNYLLQATADLAFAR